MSIVEIILFPIMVSMGAIIDAIHTVTGSYGFAVIVLSIVVYLALYPLRKFAARFQRREVEQQAAMADQLREAKATFKGEARFNEIERVYNEHNYHPIKSMRTVVGLMVQIPFLLAALLLLVDYQGMQRESFLFVRDLGEPDGLLPLPFSEDGFFARLNVLPILMLALTIIESRVARNADNSARIRSDIIGLIIFFIVYALPSAVILYWMFNNFWSLVAALVRRRERREAA